MALTLSPNNWEILVNFIAGVETLVSPARHLPADRPGVITGGYGVTDSRVHEGMEVDRKTAVEWLYDDIQKTANAVQAMFWPKVLTQTQYMALIDFAYNVGIGALENSTLKAYIQLGDMQSAAEQFTRWNHANGVVLEGLTKRRLVEKSWFLES